MTRWRFLPNLLTLLRLALVPFVIAAILAGRHVAALSLFAVAAVTDVLDGAIARRFRLISQAGAYLDPVADKCLLSGVFIAMAIAGIVPRWLVIVVFGRDIYILAGVLLLMGRSSPRRFAPSVWGKASTFVQIVTAVSWMARGVLQNPFIEALSTAMLWPCAGLTVWSAIHYTWRAAGAHVRIDATSARE